MIFESESALIRNEAGAIQEAWVSWTEARSVSEAVVHKFSEWAFLLAFAAAIVGSLMALVRGATHIVPLTLGLGAVLFGISRHLLWLGWRVPGHARLLSFHRDGGILLPLGLSPMPQSRDRLRLPHSQIVSIEAEQVVFPRGDDSTVYTHGVRLVFRQGQVGHVARRLQPDEAHLIAVRLNQALMELREDIANAEVPRARAAPGARAAAPRGGERVIN